MTDTSIYKSSTYLVVEEGSDTQAGLDGVGAVAILSNLPPQVHLYKASTYLVVEEGSDTQAGLDGVGTVALIGKPYYQFNLNNRIVYPEALNEYIQLHKGKNLLVNGSFETGDFTGWTVNAGTNGSIVSSAEDQYTGVEGRGYNFFETGGSGGANWNISQEVVFEQELLDYISAGYLVEYSLAFSVSCRADSLSYSSMDTGSIYATFFDSEGTEIHSTVAVTKACVKNDQTWYEAVSDTFKIPEGAVKANIVYTTSRKNTWAILCSDDLQFNVKVTSPDNIPFWYGKNLILNGGGEDGVLAPWETNYTSKLTLSTNYADEPARSGTYMFRWGYDYSYNDLYLWQDITPERAIEILGRDLKSLAAENYKLNLDLFGRSHTSSSAKQYGLGIEIYQYDEDDNLLTSTNTGKIRMYDYWLALHQGITLDPNISWLRVRFRGYRYSQYMWAAADDITLTVEPGVPNNFHYVQLRGNDDVMELRDTGDGGNSMSFSGGGTVRMLVRFVNDSTLERLLGGGSFELYKNADNTFGYYNNHMDDVRVNGVSMGWNDKTVPINEWILLEVDIKDTRIVWRIFTDHQGRNQTHADVAWIEMIENGTGATIGSYMKDSTPEDTNGYYNLDDYSNGLSNKVIYVHAIDNSQWISEFNADIYDLPKPMYLSSEPLQN